MKRSRVLAHNWFKSGRYIRRQNGQVFVLFAVFALPLLLAFSAICIDLGAVYVQKEQMQNAADAAVLAGAAQLTETVTADTVDDITNNHVDLYVKENLGGMSIGGSTSFVDPAGTVSGNFPSSSGTVNVVACYYNSASTSDITRKVSVELRREVPLYFLKYFGFSSMPVAVVAEAQYKPGSSGSSGSDGHNPFDNAIYTQNGDIHFNNDHIFINGNIKTDKQIWVDGVNSTDSISGTITGIHQYETEPAPTDSIWKVSDNGWNSKTNSPDVVYHELKASTDGKTLTTFSSNNYIEADESYFTQSNTEGQQIAQKYISSTVPSVGTSYINSSTHVYYDPNGSFSGQCEASNGYVGLMNTNTAWNPSSVYTSIIVNGDIYAGMFPDHGNTTAPSQVVLISLNGNITFNDSFLKDSNGNPSNIHVLIYAPNGLVTIEGSNGTNITGSIVAKSVITTNQQNIAYGAIPSFGSGSSSGSSSSASVSLIL